MGKTRESGKLTLMKGTIEYLWEEVKTMNRRKLKALSRIMIGYLRMRFREQKRPKIAHNNNPTNYFQPWP